MKRSVLMFLGMASFLIATTSTAAALTPLEQLGKAIFFDKIASPDRQACADCHAPRAGWTGPVGGINTHGAVYRGAVPQRFGNRKPPSAAYATPSPLFHYDADEELFLGGNFWDGRATGDRLGNPAADQALGPFLNPVEQNNPSKRAVLEQIASSRYATLWADVWGTPVRLGTDAEVNQDYDRIGLAIGAFEASSEVNAYTSKFDYSELGMVQLTAEEAWGKELFEGDAMCAACHPAPLFTDYTFDNLGVPKNPENPFYVMDKVYLDDGTPINPLGAAWVDPGLGGFLVTLPESYFAGLGLNKAQMVAENMGKHKVPTLRNVDLRSNPTFPKAYMHNGVFKSLKEVVHFYNTRDVQFWPPPEVAENVNEDELGNLGLTDAEENALVAFMATLSDGYVLPEPPAMMPVHARSVQQSPAAAARTLAPDRIQFSFELTREGPVVAGIYDVTGRRVRMLLNDFRAAGAYTLDVPTDGLRGGLYFVSLRATGLTLTQKFVVTP